MNKEIGQTVRCLMWFAMVVLFIVCLPQILAAIGAGIIYLFKIIAMIVIGYIAVAIIYGILCAFFGWKMTDDGMGVEKSWSFA